MGWELVYVLRVGGCNVWARGRAGVTRVKPIYLSKNNYSASSGDPKPKPK